MAASVSATDYTQIGVRVGDTADYTTSYHATNGTLTTERFRIDILQIAGTNVTFDFRWVLLNNSVEPAIMLNGDLAGYNPVREYGGSDIILVAANLGVGDDINRGDDWLRIDSTMTMLVAGWYVRTVNHVPFTGPIMTPNLPPGAKFTYSYEAYYDKMTGLLVETNITITERLSPHANETKSSIITMLTSTNAFTFPTGFTAQVSEENTIATLIITTPIALIVVTMAKPANTQHRKRKKTTN
jgi:hypothetical protein